MLVEWLVKKLMRDSCGAAAAEMAIVVPLLLLLMFGAFEMGKFFLDAHTVQKAVRDGARFAGRQSFTEMPCGGPATDEVQIKNVVRTGTPSAGGPARLSYWTNDSTITITITCDTASSYSSSGVYAGVAGGSRNVTVNASIPYDTLLGLPFWGTSINARSQSAVMGI